MWTSNDQHLGDLPPSLPRIGEPAPAFDALSTQGRSCLAELRGRWVILFSYPADFTPVCSTELMRLAQLQHEFSQRNCRLVALSLDSIYSHIAWVRELEQMGGKKITFPLIADVDMQVARAYGLIHPGAGDTAAARAVFWIDPEGLMRAMMYYPPSIGRSLAEVLRVLDSLQRVDHENVVTPADWQLGDPVIIPTPRTQNAAERRLEEEPDCQSWYLCWKKK
jgi:peroxiredoxin (alkyl hydroperoxide reductase subunit C)